MTWMVIERPSTKLYKPYYQTAKRVFDIMVCLMMTPVLLPIILIITLAIRLDSPGSTFFLQDRIGKGGQRFKIVKFRTMYHNIDRTGHQTFMKAFVNGQIAQDTVENQKGFKPFEASQVTRVGRILRKTSLDELPQLLNVFNGSMSLVGPRPNVAYEVEAYRGWHKERLEVLPGITGLAQIRGRSGITFDKIVEYDIEYIENQSLKLDIMILWWTVASVLMGKGAH
jgi:lipopolysaccharide/colanic/teichoic acid biosynthesis glycosyltransferase